MSIEKRMNGVVDNPCTFELNSRCGIRRDCEKPGLYRREFGCMLCNQHYDEYLRLAATRLRYERRVLRKLRADVDTPAGKRRR